jgi:protease I
MIITGPGFEDSEFIYPYYRLQEADFVVDVATSNDKPVTGKHGITAVPTVTLAALDSTAYDLLIIPGGHEAPDRMRQVAEILAFTRDMHSSGKVIASICHGPWVLISAGVVRGRRVTAYKSCKDDLVNAGATYLDEPVVVDQNIVTAQHFRDNAPFMKATLVAVGLQ